MLRHGRTAANAQGLLQGRVDNPLDEVGEDQARRAAGAIGAVDRVIASPLRRAQATGAALGVAVETDERFIELNYGDWEEKPVRDVPADVWKAWRSDLDLRPPGGETLRELGARVRDGLDELAAEAASSNIVVVSHVSPMKAAMAWALGIDDQLTWRLRLGQAAICRFDTSGPHPVVMSFNEQHHTSAS